MPNLNLGLIGFYKFDNNLTATIGSNGVKQGGGTMFNNFDGIINQSCQFPTSPNTVINLGSQYGFINDFSVSMWIQMKPGAQEVCLFSRYHKDAAYRCYKMGLNFNGSVFLEVMNADNGILTRITSNTGIIQGGTYPNIPWHHLVFTKNGSNMIIYVDKNKVAETSSAPIRIKSMNDTAEFKTFVGCVGKSLITNAVPGDFFRGNMDLLTMWIVGLTQEDVNELYNNGNGLSYPFSGEAYVPVTLPLPVTPTPPAPHATMVLSQTNENGHGRLGIACSIITTVPGIGDVGIIVEESTDINNWYQIASISPSVIHGLLVNSSPYTINGVLHHDNRISLYMDVALFQGNVYYYYRLRSIYNTTLSNYSSIVASYPIARQVLNSTNITSNTVSLSWTLDTSVMFNVNWLGDYYKIERKTDQVDWTEVNTQVYHANSGSWYDMGLSPNTTYYYRIRIIDTTSGMFGPYSNILTCTTLSYVPPTDIYYQLDKCEDNGSYYYTSQSMSGYLNSGERVEGDTYVYYVVSGSQTSPYYDRILIQVTNTGEYGCPY